MIFNQHFKLFHSICYQLFSFLEKFLKFSTLGFVNYQNHYLIEFCLASCLPSGLILFYIQSISCSTGNPFSSFQVWLFSEINLGRRNCSIFNCSFGSLRSKLQLKLIMNFVLTNLIEVGGLVLNMFCFSNCSCCPYYNYFSCYTSLFCYWEVLKKLIILVKLFAIWSHFIL